MLTRISLPIFLIALVLGGCSESQELRMQHYAEHLRHDALAKSDADKCKREGGFIDGRGMYGIPRCVHPYPDAGKACTDKSQCTGMCKAKNGAIIGTHDASGTVSNRFRRPLWLL